MLYSLETFHEAHAKTWQKAISDIQKIWDKYGIGTQGREGEETVEVYERLKQYHEELDELKKKYNVD